MSRAEAVRRSYEAFSRGDLDGALSLFAEDVEWHQAEGLPHGGVYRGLAEVRAAVFDPIRAEWWSAFDARPDEVVSCGDHVLVLGRYTGRSRASGAILDVPFAHVWTFQGERAVRFRQFTDTRGWVRALGFDN